MATFNLAINYPDGEGARIMAAAKKHYGVGTNAEAIEAFRKEVCSKLRDIVLQEERSDALATVVATTPS